MRTAASGLRAALARCGAAELRFARDASSSAGASSSPVLTKFREQLVDGPDFNAFINGSTLGKDGYSVEAPPLKARRPAALAAYELGILQRCRAFASSVQIERCGGPNVALSFRSRCEKYSLPVHA